MLLSQLMIMMPGETRLIQVYDILGISQIFSNQKSFFAYQFLESFHYLHVDLVSPHFEVQVQCTGIQRRVFFVWPPLEAVDKGAAAADDG